MHDSNNRQKFDSHFLNAPVVESKYYKNAIPDNKKYLTYLK